MGRGRFTSSAQLGFLPFNTSTPYLTFPQSTYNAQAFGFVLTDAGTLSETSVCCSGLTGTLASTDLVCSIYTPSSATVPNGSLVVSSSTLSAAAAANSWLRWQFASGSLSANTQYYAVITNANAAPATNYATLVQSCGALATSSNGGYGWVTLYSTNAGASWSTFGQSNIRVGLSGGTYVGMPMQVTGNPQITGVNEYGTQFTAPANVSLNVCGVRVTAYRVNSSTSGNLVLKLYTGSTPTLLASATISKTGLASNWTYVDGYFATQTIAPGTVVTVTIADDTSGDTNGYYTYSEIWDSDTNSLPLLPIDGTFKEAHYNGSVWNYTTASFIPVALLLDPTGEFTASGGGGSGGVSLSRVMGGL